MSIGKLSGDASTPSAARLKPPGAKRCFQGLSYTPESLSGRWKTKRPNNEVAAWNAAAEYELVLYL